MDRRFEKTSGDKLIVAIGSYATDWDGSGKGRNIPVQAAWDILHRSKAKLSFDDVALNPTFSYRNAEGGPAHKIWMLDGVTMFNQMAAALAMEPAGLALWRLGTEDPTVWATFARAQAPNSAALKNLNKLDPGGMVAYKGNGEILKYTNPAKVGERGLTHLSKYNLITNQWMRSSPQPMVITRWGYNKEKVIALTFDDGPSRIHTPKILDILEKKKAKASFFVVGTAAALEPQLLRRIYEEGHDIGNHTFTHPDLSEIPAVQLDLELNATQRVLESRLGIHSVLFRPPFVRDIEPETQRQARTLQASAALGYITIGQKIDPLDWGRPGTKEIVDRTVEYAQRRQGNIVLLHDGGGDRSQTIAALPQIIDTLRAKGFRFVTIHELLGLKRDELMPRLRADEVYLPYLNGFGLSVARTLNDLMTALFMIGIIFGGLRLTVIGLATWRQTALARKRTYPDALSPKFAVVVPAHNEEKVICDSIDALLRSNRSDFEILVVDDGSTDKTAERVRSRFARQQRVRLLVKPNGGKSSALNHAIQFTDAEIVICIDADTRLAADALTHLLPHFSDHRVGAVAGVVTVGNPTTLLARFQALEYITSQSLDRRAFELVNGMAVVPGAIGAWRRQALLDVGLYDTDTYAEDADVTIKLERAGWRVIDEPKALAVTEAPETIREFNKQRFRWMFGTLQVAYKHAGIYRQRGIWGLKLFTFPNIVLFQFLFTLISPVMDVLLVAAIGTDLWSYAHHGGDVLSSGSIEILIYWGIFQSLEMAFAAIGLFLHGAIHRWKLLPLIILQRFGYRQLIFWIAMRTLFAALRGRFATWGRAKRVGLGPSADGNASSKESAPALMAAE